ncbi:hypothetical protein E3N88_26656 [Mikania micrantha]|uniref:Uncharacterized protein n=1 Tax=Mikania micrantha TaxID=192012 RepID=A0A5N6MX53_9ASTR|nr:hypothetical protein E3N88_26656 [Mikania micrantha]
MAGRVSPAVILMSVVQKQRQLILNRKVRSLRRWCSKPSGDRDPGNLLLKTAWYGSELLGIAASFFRSPEKLVEREVAEDECEFADPVGSFKGVSRFKRNCTNFGSLIEKSSMKLMKWEDFEVLIKIKEWDIGVSGAPWPSHGSLFFQLQVIQSIILAKNQEKYAGKACRALECPKDGIIQTTPEAESTDKHVNVNSSWFHEF